MLAVLADVWGTDESTELLGRNTAGHLYLFEPDNTEKSTFLRKPLLYFSLAGSALSGPFWCSLSRSIEMDQMYQSVTSITYNLPLLR